MAWRILKRIATIGGVVILLLMLILSLSFVKTVNAVTLTLSPVSGHVGEKVNVSGEVPPNYTWTIAFDIDGNGIFGSDEKMVSEKAGSSSTLLSSFIVPACVGNDTGVPHAVKLTTDFPELTSAIFAAADPYSPIDETKIFTVYTQRTSRVPATVLVGASIPVSLVITGGKANAAYNYRVDVTKPDGSTSACTFTATTNVLGSVSKQVTYPADFPSGQSTSQIGNYNIAIRELSPLVALQNATNVVVYTLTPPYSQPIATIISIQPNSTTVGTPISFAGYGNASSGYSIVKYRWISNISGNIGSTPTFTTNSLPVGIHRIIFDVQDNNNTWSTPTATNLRIDPMIITDPPSSSNDSLIPPTSNGSESSNPTPKSANESIPPDSSPPTPQQNNGNGIQNVTNQPPIARLTSTPPTQINSGQSMILTADATDQDGTIAGYIWTSDIDGVVSTSNQLDTINLTPGRHYITFQATDDDGAVSNTVLLELTVNPKPGSDFLPIVGVASAGTAIAVSAGAFVWVHYDHLNSVKIKNKLSKRNAVEKQHEENQEKKDEKRSKKRANLVVSDFKIPTNIMKNTAYAAQFKVTNLGSAKATNIRVNTLANRFFGIKDPVVSVRDLSPGEHEMLNIPFTTNSEIRKNLYQLQFEVKSKQTPSKVKRCFMRGGRIAVLTDTETPNVAEPVLSWLRANRYPFEEIHNAGHLMTQLYQYDLLVVSANHDLPSKWVHNLVTFVENGQSVLILDKISTRSPERLTEALGYVEEPTAVNIRQAALEICHQHPITNGLPVGETIPLGPCIENTVKFTQTPTPATIIANNVNQQSNLGTSSPVAAVMVKQDGKGKIVHLNFHAQEHLNQIDRLIKNSVDWLLWD